MNVFVTFINSIKTYRYSFESGAEFEDLFKIFQIKAESKLRLFCNEYF